MESFRQSSQSMLPARPIPARSRTALSPLEYGFDRCLNRERLGKTGQRMRPPLDHRHPQNTASPASKA